MFYIEKLLRTVSLTALLISASSVSAQNSPELKLADASLKREQWVNFNPRFTAAKSGDDSIDYFPSEVRPPRGTHERVIYSENYSIAEVTAHNTGAKTIKVITWEL